VQLSVDLTLTPTADGSFTCKGTVAQVPIDSANPAHALGDWLARIDASELEAAALEAQSHSDGSYTVVVLELLRRWANP
jgi:hypothetical protein